MGTYNTTLVREDCDLELEIEYTYYCVQRGHRDKYGAPEEPDEDEYVEIDSASDATTGEIIELTSEELAKLEEDILESLDNYH